MDGNGPLGGIRKGKADVALHAERVDGNPDRPDALQSIRVALHAERVDGNNGLGNYKVLVTGRAPCGARGLK